MRRVQLQIEKLKLSTVSKKLHCKQEASNCKHKSCIQIITVVVNMTTQAISSPKTWCSCSEIHMQLREMSSTGICFCKRYNSQCAIHVFTTTLFGHENSMCGPCHKNSEASCTQTINPLSAVSSSWKETVPFHTHAYKSKKVNHWILICNSGKLHKWFAGGHLFNAISWYAMADWRPGALLDCVKKWAGLKHWGGGVDGEGRGFRPSPRPPPPPPRCLEHSKHSKHCVECLECLRHLRGGGAGRGGGGSLPSPPA